MYVLTCICAHTPLPYLNSRQEKKNQHPTLHKCPPPRYSVAWTSPKSTLEDSEWEAGTMAATSNAWLPRRAKISGYLFHNELQFLLGQLSHKNVRRALLTVHSTYALKQVECITLATEQQDYIRDLRQLSWSITSAAYNNKGSKKPWLVGYNSHLKQLQFL